MTEVLHTADTHIGYRQYNSPDRRTDFLDAFDRVADDAVDLEVDAVIHAGDVFHDRRPALQDILGTVATLRRLADAAIPFLAVVGNHEDKREAQWLDLFESLGLATRLDRSGTVVGDVTFYGLDYVPRSRRETVDLDFDPPSTDRSVLVAHGQFAPLSPNVRGSAWDLEEVFERSSISFDAALLGDEHEPMQTTVDGIRVTYAGSTERTSATERDDRGYNLVSFTDDTVDVRRRGISTRPFTFIDVDLATGEGVDRVLETIRAHDTDGAVVIVTIEGEGEAVTPATVEEFARERGALVARVNDRRDRESSSEERSVSFADPDDAVRKRVREMGLSPAARTVDETVRASELADSNVREMVRDRVEEQLEEAPDAFERPSDEERSVAPQSPSGQESTADTSESSGGPQDGDTSSLATEQSDVDESAEASTDEEPDTGEVADQASMEEFL